MAVKKKATGKKVAAKADDKPRIIPAKETVSAASLISEAAMMMDEPLSRSQTKAFVDSLGEIIEANLAEGRAVNLFGYLKIVPRFHTKGKREVREVFGDPESKMIVKSYPAKVSVKASFLKKTKDALPQASKLGRILNG